MPYRPKGVNILLVTFIVFATLGVITAAAIEFIIVPEYPTLLIGSSILSFFYYIFMIQIFAPYFPFPLTPETMENLSLLLLSSMLLSLVNYLSLIDRFHLVTFLVLIGAILYIASAAGLLKMMNWGRYLALTVGEFNIILGIVLTYLLGVIDLIFLLSGIGILMFGALIIIYMRGDVKYEFEEIPTGVYRPEGVILLTITLMFVASISIVEGILLFTSFIPNLYNIQVFLEIYSFSIYPRNVGLIILSYNIMAVAILIFGVLSIPISIGLINMKKWGHTLGLHLGNLAMFLGAAFFAVAWVLWRSTGGILIGIPIGIILCILGGVMDVYLNGAVKEEFKKG